MTVWEQGLQAFQQGRLFEAADRLQDAALEHERTVSQETRFMTLCHLGAALYAMGRFPEAVTAFTDALRLAPPPAPRTSLLINLANAYLAVGRLEDGRMALREALQETPGNLEAQMLLQRLDRHTSSDPPTGAVLGEDLEGVRRYLQTLSFSRRVDGGFEPDEVQLAITQVGRYLNLLADQVTARNEIIAGLEAELAWARQQLNAINDEQKADTTGLTPLEILFQKKP